MQKLVLVSALIVGSGLALHNTSHAHGGSYRGPGDTVPPGGGGGGGGGGGPSGPGPAGPGGAGPAGPSAPGPAGPGVPTGAGGGGGRVGTGAATQNGPDLTLWEYWWGFNKDQYLNLKAAIHQSVLTGSDEFFLTQSDKTQAKNSLKPSEEAIRQKIVPALKAALEKERSNDIVTGAMVGLAKIGDATNEAGVSEFEGIISRFLGDANQEIAETAAVALGILGNDSSVKTLESLLDDQPEGRKKVGSNEVPIRTRAFAGYGLALIGNRTVNVSVQQEIARILVEALRKPDTSTKDIKVAALIALGLVPLPVETAESPESSTEPWASRQHQVAFIKKYFQDENVNFLIRAHAPTALARLIKDCPPDLRESTTKLLIDALGKFSKQRDEVMQSSVLALGQIGDCDKDKQDVEIRETLKRMVEDGDQQSRNFAMMALGQVGARPGAGEGSEDGLKDVRSFLLTSMTKGKSRIRPWAALSIGVMERGILDNNQAPSSTAKDALRTALKDCASPSDLGAYALGCGVCKDSEAKSTLLDKLANVADNEARGYVAVALGLMDARDAIKPIQDIVRESKYKPDLLKQAAIGLGLLGDKELVPDLVKMLGEAKSLASQAAIASALEFIGDSRSIDPLVEMLQRPEITASARGFAAVALGIVADREPLPWNAKISTNINYRASTSTLTDESSSGVLNLF